MDSHDISYPCNSEFTGNCGLIEHGISRAEKQKSCKAFKHKCGSCGKIGHFESTCRSKRGEGNLIEEDVSDQEEVGAFGEIFALEKLEKQSGKLLVEDRGVQKLNHYAWNAFQGWRPARGEVHPQVNIEIVTY